MPSASAPVGSGPALALALELARAAWDGLTGGPSWVRCEGCGASVHAATGPGTACRMCGGVVVPVYSDAAAAAILSAAAALAPLAARELGRLEGGA